MIDQKFQQSTNESISKIFGEFGTVLSLKQPPNINRKNPPLPKLCLLLLVDLENMCFGKYVFCFMGNNNKEQHFQVFTLTKLADEQSLLFYAKLFQIKGHDALI